MLPTPNSLIVTVITLLVGWLMKKTKWIPNDMIAHLTFWVSQIAAYALAVLGNLVAAPAHAQPVVPVATSPDSTAFMPDGLTGYVLTYAWDWLGRKFMWGKVLKPLLHK